MLLCIRQSSTMRIKILGRIGTSNEYEPLEEDELGQEEEIPGVLIVKIYDSLTFGEFRGALLQSIPLLTVFLTLSERGNAQGSTETSRAM